MVSRLRSARVRAPRARPGLALALALTAVLAAILAGCGGSGDDLASKSAAEILAASRSAAQSASSVHVLNTTTRSRRTTTKGKHTTTKDKQATVAQDDLYLIGDGAHTRTTFLGRTQETIHIGDALYVKGGPVFYARLAKRTGTHLPVGTWLKETPSISRTEETELRSQLGFLLRAPTLSLTKGATTTIDGQKAIELKTKGKLYTGAIYIAATGQPYPIEIVRHGKEAGAISETGLTTFSGWNDPVTLTPPAGAVELSGLERQAKG